MQTLARELEVSHATVSYVLSGKAAEKKIPPETVRRVMEAARKHSYVPNYWAQSLARQQRSGIGLLFPDLRFDSVHDFVSGVDGVLHESPDPQVGRSLFLSVWFWDPQRERDEIEALLSKQIAGLICQPHEVNAEFYRELRQRGFPVIFVAESLKGFQDNFVMIDGSDAVGKVLQHLVSLGHRRIAVIGPDGPSVTHDERYAAARQRLQKLGADTDPRLMIFSKTGQQETVFTATDRILSMDPRPTAILGINDPVAHEVMHQLTCRGLKVGEDIAVAGIGDIGLSRYEMCSLTTVQERRSEMGRIAAELLLDQTAGRSGPVPGIRVKGELIVRRSSCNPK
jgi:LacI family transcriptional regulator